MTDNDANLHDVLRDDVRSMVSGDPDQEPRDAVPPEVALKAVAPRPVPSIVLSVGAKNPQEVARMLSRIPAQLDDTVARYPVKIELRLDALPHFSERMTAASLVFKLGVPLILTLRSRREGGATTATEPERQRFFRSMLGALRQDPPPGSLIDIEAAAVAGDPEGWGPVIALAHQRGFHLLLSHHDLESSPEKAQSLLPPDGLLDQTPGGAALIWKSATSVRTWQQGMAILRALARGNTGQRRAAVMGIESTASRLLAPFFGAPLVYASIDPEQNTASGQVPFADLVRVWTRWGIDVEDHGLLATGDRPAPRWALLGRPALHSLSSAMHNAAARDQQRPERYFPLEISEHSGSGTEYELFRDTLRDLPRLGVTAGNVTIPFKVHLAAAADRLEDEARALGAANTFVFDGDQITAHNTDVIGFRTTLEAAGIDIARTNALVLGAGGAAAAVVAALHDAATIQVANRTHEHAEAIQERVNERVEVVPWATRGSAAQAADLVVNATPVGMMGGPAPDASPLPSGHLHDGQTVFDTVYVQRRTPLLKEAATAGAATIDGLRFLLHQGVASYRIWTGQDAPQETMWTALERAEQIPFPDNVRAAVLSQEVQA